MRCIRYQHCGQAIWPVRFEENEKNEKKNRNSRIMYLRIGTTETNSPIAFLRL